MNVEDFSEYAKCDHCGHEAHKDKEEEEDYKLRIKKHITSAHPEERLITSFSLVWERQ